MVATLDAVSHIAVVNNLAAAEVEVALPWSLSMFAVVAWPSEQV